MFSMINDRWTSSLSALGPKAIRNHPYPRMRVRRGPRRDQKDRLLSAMPPVTRAIVMANEYGDASNCPGRP